jgi:TRAP-type C4-dicarboxylate transport system permease large subunit
MMMMRIADFAISMEYGIEPIHFGILVTANLAFGLITPPIGLVLSTAAAVAKLPIERVVRPAHARGPHRDAVAAELR